MGGYIGRDEILRKRKNFEDSLHGKDKLNGVEIKLYKEKGSMKFICGITSLLSTVMENLEADLSKQESAKQIKHNIGAAKRLIFDHIHSNGRDGVLEEDMEIIYVGFVNLTTDVYRGLKKEGKFKNFLISMNKTEDDEDKEE